MDTLMYGDGLKTNVVNSIVGDVVISHTHINRCGEGLRDIVRGRVE
jgi:hypothetical protein